ncbi:hypothetical protein CP500_010880 [Tychonema bourrellyi FEM_GT703]|uniref:Uncharacterized protein n=1 Tax=Tychonema bourrellyi FEM_GT703 TaxID=2040638 RepID=A0A2G4F125_9CYAN|nr:hypothetical protein CP500_010880 [Tychonema bourrellyi FEM_GT703]
MRLLISKHFSKKKNRLHLSEYSQVSTKVRSQLQINQEVRSAASVLINLIYLLAAYDKLPQINYQKSLKNNKKRDCI